MADSKRTCPHCDEEIVLFKCQNCKAPAVRDDDETCTMCEKDFCPDCRNDHDCDGTPDEESEDDAEDDLG